MLISVAILKAAKSGARKTHLLNSVSLSYEQFTKYIELLEVHGFVKSYDTLYQTTDKGLELIEEFDSSPLIRKVLAARAL